MTDPEAMTPDDIANYLDRGVARALEHLETVYEVPVAVVEAGWTRYQVRAVTRLVTFLLMAGVERAVLERGVAEYLVDDVA